MLVVGFHRANRLIMGISIAFLVVFLSAFYYNLDITLINKSYILLGTGAILIAAPPFPDRGLSIRQHGGVA